MGEGQEQKRPGRDPQGSPKHSRHRWVPCRGVAGLEKEGVGQLSDPLMARGEAEEGLWFDAWRTWAKRAVFRINGRRLPTGVDEGTE